MGQQETNLQLTEMELSGHMTLGSGSIHRVRSWNRNVLDHVTPWQMEISRKTEKMQCPDVGKGGGPTQPFLLEWKIAMR